MVYDILEHPDAPSFEEMDDYVVEPVAPDVIRDNREAEDLTLVEENLLDHPAIDAYVELTKPGDRHPDDVGTVLYRLTQLFGTPQFEEYMAGTDISWRSDETFKYLLRVRKGVDEHSDHEQADDEWLVTVHDWKVRLGVSLAEWREDPDADLEVDAAEMIPVIAVLTNAVTNPVECEYEDKFF